MYNLNGEATDEVPITEPNRMADIYRSYQPSAIPFQIERHLNCIDISEDGCMLLGSSTLNGRYWTGSVYYYNETTSLIDKEKYLTGFNCESVIVDGKFIDSKKILIGEDSGCLSLLTLAEIEDEDATNSTHLVSNFSTFDHDDAVLTLSVSPDKSSFVSGGMDKCIKVWDVDQPITQSTFRPAHSHLVTCVHYSPFSNSVFASSSLDGFALMWDVRNDKPATEIRKSNGEGLTAVAWHPSDGNLLAIGTNYGMISIYDVRSLNTIASTECFNRPVHKLAFNNYGLLAACGDTNEVKVLQCKSVVFETLYTDNRHEYFVRGVSWHSQHRNLFYSCGWDQQVLSHNLPTMDSEVS